MAAKQATPGSSEDCAVTGFCMELWNALKLVFVRMQLASQLVMSLQAGCTAAILLL